MDRCDPGRVDHPPDPGVYVSTCTCVRTRGVVYVRVPMECVCVRVYTQVFRRYVCVYG